MNNYKNIYLIYGIKATYLNELQAQHYTTKLKTNSKREKKLKLNRLEMGLK